MENLVLQPHSNEKLCWFCRMVDGDEIAIKRPSKHPEAIVVMCKLCASKLEITNRLRKREE